MRITRKGFYTVTYDGQPLKKKDGSIRRVTSRDECYERITEDGRDGKFTIHCPDREVDVGLIIVAAPPSGAFAQGDTFTLNGSGFDVVLPYKFDDFTGGNVGDSINGRGSPPWSAGADNSPNPTDQPPSIDTEQSYDGTPSCLADILTGGDCWAYLGGLNTDELYTSIMLYAESEFDNDNQKNVRVHADTGGSNKFTSYPSMFHQNFLSGATNASSERISVNTGTDSTGDNDDSYNGGSNTFTLDTWHREESYFLISTPGVADGTAQHWRDLDLKINATSIITRDTGVTDKIELVLMPFYARRAARYWYDYVYVAKSRGRVEIGDANTWAGCTVRAIQESTAVSPTQVTFTVNRAGLSNGTNYVYTVDSDGNETQQGEIEIA